MPCKVVADVHSIDWLVVCVYLLAMMALAVFVGHAQSSRRDYFLGGNRLSPLSLATSTIATQCSTNSLLGAPAFVGFAAGGGMLWLQYELAVPIAMFALIWLLGTVRRSAHISVYAFLEERLGSQSRLLASSVFLVFRGIATGVTVYGAALIVTLLIDISYTQAVLLLMGVTIAYDLIGGMRAVVISDVIQMILVISAVAVSLVVLTVDMGGLGQLAQLHADSPRATTLQFSWGLNGEGQYGFWPMLFGGLFLYMAYYGCDQSQAQRVLSSQSPQQTEKVLMLNGILRFPVVLLYCLLGLALAAYASQHSGFVDSLPLTSTGLPNYNLVFPAYVLQAFPPGLVGLILVGIFAAAMSSIDSSLNALSAATIEDFLTKFGRQIDDERQFFIASKGVTLAWGLFAVLFSYQVETIAPTVLETINKIGSLANGPLLGLFATALLIPGVGQRRAIAGFVAGLACNFILWLGVPSVSWLWWNVSGCLVTLLIAAASGHCRWRRPTYAPGPASRWILGVATLVIVGLCLLFRPFLQALAGL